MDLDVLDTVKSSFNDVFSKLGAIALLGQIAVGAIYGISLGLLTMGGAAGTAIGIIGILAYLVAGLAYAVGIFRVFRNEEFDIKYFKNFGWPGFRLLTAGLTISTLAGTALYALAIPVVFMSSLGSAAGIGGGATLLAGLLGLVGLVAALYIATATVLSIPIIPTEGKRTFEALDEAIQRSKGNRGRMFLTALPSIVLLVIGGASIALLGEAVGLAVYAALAIISGIYHIAVLNQLSERLD